MSIKGRDAGGERVICTRFHNSKTCDNNRTFYLEQIERTVLSGLRKHLVDPSAISEFMREYQAERKRLAQHARGRTTELKKEREDLIRKINRLAEAMIDSEAPISAFTSRISELERRRQTIETELTEAAGSEIAIALHPTAQARYLAAVENLTNLIRDEEPFEAVASVLRELIESVVVERTAPGTPVRLTVNGKLAALVGGPLFPQGSLSGAKLVAGEGLEPPTPGL